MSPPERRLRKLNPATGALVWAGWAADECFFKTALAKARAASRAWRNEPVAERIQCLERFADLVRAERESLATTISAETGKPFWETRQEADSVIGKIALTVAAWHAGEEAELPASPGITLRVQRRPLGIVAVLGPFNLPAHLPHGQIAPALLAGNAVLFKPSPLAPATADWMLDRWHRAGLPEGVLQILHGGGEVGQMLAADPGVNAIFFTGSRTVGAALHRALAGQPERLLALEMGGNNPLILGSCTDREAALHVALESAFISAGQRCTCARRLIVPRGESGDEFIARLAELAGLIRLGAPEEVPEPFLGPVISLDTVGTALRFQQTLLDLGARAHLPLEHRRAPLPFLRPGILELPPGVAMPDEEIFAPLLVVQRARDFDDALELANDTRFGLAAGLLSDDPAEYAAFSHTVEAGVLAWNTPTTGASGRLPFGGIKASGNHRPAGWTMGASCSAPVAVREGAAPLLAPSTPPGLRS